MHVRAACPDDHIGVRNVLDAGLLAIEETTLQAAITDGCVLVALDSNFREDDGPVLGALVVADGTVEAVAVRPGRRGQGVGTALVEAALDRHGRLEAAFDERVRPFWESLGIAIDSRENGRYRGTLCVDDE